MHNDSCICICLRPNAQFSWSLLTVLKQYVDWKSRFFLNGLIFLASVGNIGKHDIVRVPTALS